MSEPALPTRIERFVEVCNTICHYSCKKNKIFVHTTQLTNIIIASDQIGCQDVSQGWLGESPLGADYQGNASVTVSGRTCQKWSLQTPHRHRVKGQGDHNYCRNPDGEPGVWCYTTDPGKRWELCPVPRCTSLPIGVMSIRFHGTVKIIFLSGLFCGPVDHLGRLLKQLRWRSSKPK